jgi:hypothetical protein
VAVAPVVAAPVVETPVAVAPASPPVRRAAAPSHLASAIPAPPTPGTELAISTPRSARGGHRRVTAPAGATAAAPASAAKPAEKPAHEPAEKPAHKPAEKRPAAAAKPAAKSAPEPSEAKAAPAAPATASAPLVTEVEHTVGKAKELDFAFAALPTATAAEQRAGELAPELEDSTPIPPVMVERPIVIKPDPPRRVSRFAPDPTKLGQRVSGAYANAPAPSVGTEGTRPDAKVAGTVVETVSIRVKRDVIEAATVPPPIRHILPRPGSTVPPKAVEAARPSAPEPEPELVELRPRTGPVPVPPLAREPLPADEPTRVIDLPRDEDPDPAPDEGDDDPTAETRAIPTVAGSLLGEIGGLPRVEVRAARPAAVTDTAPNPEREARESYEHRARQLERVAHERLMREQQRLAVDIREQLAHDKRELESVLDNRLEDTVLRPVALSARRAADPRFSDPSDDTGDTR